MPRQAIVRLQLDEIAKQKLNDLCELRDMTQIAILSRLVTWLGKQDEVVQASVLGLLSDKALGILSGSQKHNPSRPKNRQSWLGGRDVNPVP